jgi:class 3 adenylate cyclase
LTELPRDPAPQDVTLAAQRRQITVMFCDLIGSTALSSQLDPEEMYEVLRTYQSRCTEVIEQAGGFVAKYLGDGVLAYFGYPQAHEDDPERAIQAGLVIAGLVPGVPVPGGRQLAARIGIATGLVIVGELIGAGAAEERAVTGETPNLAARLQEAAPPGGVVVSAATRRLAAGLFDFADLGLQAFKGLPRPEPVWLVTGHKAAADRFAARHEREPAPLVGREAELAEILERWGRALAGETEIVGLVGEPGIGKSRLIYELRGALAGEPHVWLEGGGAQVFRNTPFHVAAQMVRRTLAAEGALTADGYLEALTAALRQAGVEAPHALPLIADLIGAPTRDEQAPLTLDPDQRRALLMAALSEWLVKTAARSPTLLVIEDLHWVDPSTLELFAEVVPKIAASRLMVVYSTREAAAAPWPLGPRHRQLALPRLDAESLQRLVASTAGESLAPDLAASVVARAGGVPLFAEELARLMLDRPDRAGAREIPGTLSDLLMARLDQLGPAKETAQIASVLGAEFHTGLLAAVAGLSAEDLDVALARLLESDLVVERRGAAEGTYGFKHALILDAAYEALLRSQRRALHARAAAILGERFPDLARDQPEVLAQHWTRAGETERAIAAWSDAGRAARVRRAYREAERAYLEGLALVMSLPEGAERDRHELGLRYAHVLVLLATRGYASPEAIEASAKARALAERAGDLKQQVVNTAGVWSAASAAGDYQRACEIAEQAMPLALAAAAPESLAVAGMMVMTSRYRVGDILGAEEAYREGAPHFEAPEARRIVGPTPQFFGNGAVIAWLLDERREAYERIARCVAFGRESQNPYELAFATHMAAMQMMLMAEVEQAIAFSNESIRLSDEHGFPHFAANSRLVLGRAIAERGRAAEGVGMIRDSLQSMDARPRSGATMYLTWLAEALAQAGAPEEALEAAEQSLVVNPNELFFRPGSFLTRGDMRAALGDLAGAAADYREAVALSKAISAKVFHTRAAASLARLQGVVAA